MRVLRRLVHERRAGAVLMRISRSASCFVAARRARGNELTRSPVREILFEHNPALAIVRFDGETLRLKARFPYHLPRLPDGYHFKGGAARLALAYCLALTPAGMRPRDLDIVRFGEGRRNLDDLIARRFMPEDFRHGHGVEVCASIDTYMQTRDLTVNEVVLCGEEIVCSRQAVMDMVRHILRPSRSALSNGVLHPMTALKMIRLYACAKARGQTLRLVDFPNSLSVQKARYLTQLKRARAEGDIAENIFISECENRGIVLS